MLFSRGEAGEGVEPLGLVGATALPPRGDRGEGVEPLGLVGTLEPRGLEGGEVVGMAILPTGLGLRGVVGVEVT